MKKIILITVILCTILLFNACTTEDVMFPEARQYANWLRFHMSIGAFTGALERIESRGYTHMVFVHSEEEFLMGDFPDNAIVAWPSLRTHLKLNRINFWVRDGDMRADLETYSLTYPLTKDDLVYNWKNILELQASLGSLVNDIDWHAHTEHERLMFPELHLLVEAFEVAGIDVTEHGLELPLYSQNATRIFWDIFRARLYDKLDEDVQLRLEPEIPIFLAEYRNELRFVEWWQAE